MDSLFAWLPLLAEDTVHYALVIAAILVITITLLLRGYRYQARQKRGSSSHPSKHQVDKDPRGLRAGAPDSIVRWEVEMQELARDLKAEIDSKMVALQHLIHDADRAANRLETALGSASSANAESSEEQRAAGPQALENEALREEVYTLADYGFSLADIASRLATSVGQIELILRLREEKE
jgi:hypothetical protein